MIDLVTARRLLKETLPSYQATSKEDNNLGFGQIYYGITRAMRAEEVLVIGSKAGFAPLCFALGIAHNAGVGIKESTCYSVTLKSSKKGKVWFVDPSFSEERGDDSHWYGIGTWDDADKTKAIWESFNLDDIVQHFKLKSDKFLERKDCPKNLDIVYIDGDHSYEGILHDITQYAPLLSPDGIIMAHDVDPLLNAEFPQNGGFEAIESLNKSDYEVFRLPIYPGLAFIRVK